MNDLATLLARVEAELARNAHRTDVENATFLHELAELKLASGDAEGAVAAYAKCVGNIASTPGLLNNFGTALIRTGRFDAALDPLDAALLHQPRYLRAMVNRGKALCELGRLDEAIAQLRSALVVQTDYVPALLNLGEALCAAGDMHEAVTVLERAVHEEPRRAEGRSALGIAFLQAGNPACALHHLRAAVEIAPHHAEAHANLAHCLFVTDAWEAAWPHFEYRFRRTARPVDLPAPVGMQLWSGDIATQRRVWLIGEQGLGDQLQFARYARFFQESGLQCVLVCDPRLVALLTHSQLAANIVAYGARIAHTLVLNRPSLEERYFPLMSLPRLHGTRPTTVPYAGGYLRVERPLIERWRARLPTEGVRVGLAWAGNPRMETGRYVGRSPPLSAFGQAVSIPNTHWISLQKGSGEAQLDTVFFRDQIQRFDNLDEGVDGFLDTAAILKSVDLLVTSDSAIAHLGGALGVPTWLCLMHEPDWRWMRHGNTTPWYSSMRLFRQSSRGDWGSVVGAVTAALAAGEFKRH